jgi:hypothetical protein
MTRFFATTALALALAAPAVADSDMLRSDVEDMLEASPTNVQVESLTDEQVRALYAATNSDMSAAERERLIESIAGDAEYDMDADMESYGDFGGANNIRAVVEQMANENELEIDVSELNSDQVAGLYMIFTGGDEPDQEEIESIIR